jgi:hypothetical protein
LTLKENALLGGARRKISRDEGSEQCGMATFVSPPKSKILLRLHLFNENQEFVLFGVGAFLHNVSPSRQFTT